MDILEKLELFLEAIGTNKLSSDTISADEFNSSSSVIYSFMWKGSTYIFHADLINNGDWLIDFEDSDGNTVVLNNFGAATHSLWSLVLLCLKTFVDKYKPKSFYFKGGTNSHDLLYDTERARNLIQKETKYKEPNQQSLTKTKNSSEDMLSRIYHKSYIFTMEEENYDEVWELKCLLSNSTLVVTLTTSRTEKSNYSKPQSVLSTCAFFIKRLCKKYEINKLIMVANDKWTKFFSKEKVQKKFKELLDFEFSSCKALSNEKTRWVFTKQNPTRTENVFACRLFKKT